MKSTCRAIQTCLLINNFARSTTIIFHSFPHLFTFLLHTQWCEIFTSPTWPLKASWGPFLRLGPDRDLTFLGLAHFPILCFEGSINRIRKTFLPFCNLWMAWEITLTLSRRESSSQLHHFPRFPEGKKYSRKQYTHLLSCFQLTRWRAGATGFVGRKFLNYLLYYRLTKENKLIC